jgi:cold shock CspA family protein
MQMPVGEICSLVTEKGFGFIKPKTGGADVFFHNSVVNCPVESLKLGQEVEFEIDTSVEKVRAKSVTVRGAGGRKSADQRRSSTPGQRFVKTEFGYVTKMLWKKQQGFISADSAGAELLFNESDVIGDKRYQQLKVGDYVRFIRNDSSAIRNPIHEPPTVRSVEVIQRVPKKVPIPEVPNNPRARRKKPTWR